MYHIFICCNAYSNKKNIVIKHSSNYLIIIENTDLSENGQLIILLYNLQKRVFILIKQQYYL